MRSQIRKIWGIHSSTYSTSVTQPGRKGRQFCLIYLLDRKSHPVGVSYLNAAVFLVSGISQQIRDWWMVQTFRWVCWQHTRWFILCWSYTGVILEKHMWCESLKLWTCTILRFAGRFGWSFDVANGRPKMGRHWSRLVGYPLRRTDKAGRLHAHHSLHRLDSYGRQVDFLAGDGDVGQRWTTRTTTKLIDAISDTLSLAIFNPFLFVFDHPPHLSLFHTKDTGTKQHTIHLSPNLSSPNLVEVNWLVCGWLLFSVHGVAVAGSHLWLTAIKAVPCRNGRHFDCFGNGQRIRDSSVTSAHHYRR